MDREQILSELKDYLKRAIESGWEPTPEFVLDYIDSLEEEYE